MPEVVEEAASDDVRGSVASFADLLLPVRSSATRRCTLTRQGQEALVRALSKAGFTAPSPVQEAAIPLGRFGADLIVQARSSHARGVSPPHSRAGQVGNGQDCDVRHHHCGLCAAWQGAAGPRHRADARSGSADAAHRRGPLLRAAVQGAPRCAYRAQRRAPLTRIGCAGTVLCIRRRPVCRSRRLAAAARLPGCGRDSRTAACATRARPPARRGAASPGALQRALRRA